MKLLIISSRFPYPVEKGDKLRLYYQIQELSKYFELVLLCLSDQEVSETDQKKLAPYCSSITLYRLRWPSISRNLVLGYLKGLPAQISYFFNQKTKRQIHQLIAIEKPDHIYCQLIRTTEYTRDLSIPMTLDYMDCFSLNSYKRSLHSPFWSKWFWQMESKRLKKYESKIYPYFQHHTIIAPVDAETMGLKKNQPLTLVSNGISTRYVEPDNHSRDIDVLFLGNLSYFSNIQAVEFLIDKIIPILSDRTPSLEISIAGAHPGRKITNLIKHSRTKIALYSNVNDTRSIYRRSKIFVAPITLGTGQQNKVLEAMACGCEVICSEEVRAGLPSIADYLTIAADANQYAHLIAEKLSGFDQNKYQRLSARESVQHNFNWQRNTLSLIELIKPELKSTGKTS